MSSSTASGADEHPYLSTQRIPSVIFCLKGWTTNVSTGCGAHSAPHPSYCLRLVRINSCPLFSCDESRLASSYLSSRPHNLNILAFGGSWCEERRFAWALRRAKAYIARAIHLLGQGVAPCSVVVVLTNHLATLASPHRFRLGAKDLEKLQDTLHRVINFRLGERLVLRFTSSNCSSSASDGRCQKRQLEIVAKKLGTVKH